MVELSAASSSVWAKSDRSNDGRWLPLWRHLDDSAGVAADLWDRFVPDTVRRLVSRDLPGGDDDGRALVSWMAGVHDVGKASPAFAVQWKPGFERMAEAGLTVTDMRYVLAERSVYRHELASMAALESWLGVRGWSRRSRLGFSAIVGSHHGRAPSSTQIKQLGKYPELLGEGIWDQVRVEHLDRAAREMDLTERIGSWSNVALSKTAQVLTVALVIVADWVASDDERFEYGECIHDESRVAEAMRALDLPRPWQPKASSVLAGFAPRFDLPVDATPRPVQVAAVEAASSTETASLMVIEAPMGDGKTEAALLAAEVLAAKFGCGGVFFGLPTRATANAIFGRSLHWLDALSEIDPTGTQSVTLAHGKAALDDRYTGLQRIGRRYPGRTDTEASTTLAVHQWMSGRKKALLSNFAVGTIDQFLLAALKSKHLMLRHLGLAGKVVVLDEVHAYDAYMSVYLEMALEWMGAYGVPVVALSATLPAAQRIKLVAAYDRGARSSLTSGERADKIDYSCLDGDIGYPVITASTGSVPDVHAVAGSTRRTDVLVRRLDDDDEHVGLVELLREQLADGGVAVVIRNTVGRAQNAVSALRAAFPDDEVSVHHSRFIAAHREANDRRLLERFGRDGDARRRDCRYIVVATQVAEQSLDVDFDVMVTDVAPIDLLLQRMGRLHRHTRPGQRPDRLRRAQCFVGGIPDWSSAPPVLHHQYSKVYPSYLLHRTLAAIEHHLDGGAISLPDSIPGLVQQVYDPDQAEFVPLPWRNTVDKEHTEFAEEQESKESRAEPFRLGSPAGSSIVDWMDTATIEVDSDDSRVVRQQVRDSEPSLDVLVIRRMGDGSLRTMPGIGEHSDVELPTDCKLPRDLEKAVAASSLTLPRMLSRPDIVDAVIADLEPLKVEAWQENYLLEGELMIALDERDHAAVLDDFDVAYSLEDGVTVTSLADPNF